MQKNKKPTSCSLLLTEKCNLACSYCFEAHKKDKFMDETTAEKAVEYLIKNAKYNGDNSIFVTFFGGEPTLNLKVMEHCYDYAFERCKEESIKFDCQIITNSILVTDQYKDFIRKWKKQSGTINLQLSIDGPPEIQDMYRVFPNGKGSSEVIEKSINEYLDLANELDLITKGEIHVHGVLNKHSIGKLFESYKYFIDKGFKKTWFIPVHNEIWEDEHVELYKRELTKVCDYMYEKCKELNNLEYYHSYSTLCKSMREKHPDKTCGAGYTYCTITTEGKVFPCHGFYFNNSEEFLFADVVTGYEDDDQRSIFLDYSSENLFGDKPCNECDHYQCYRCIADNYVNNKNIQLGFPQFCKLSRVEQQVRDNLISKLQSLGLLKNNNKSSCNCGNECGSKKDVNAEAIKQSLLSIEDKVIGLQRKYSQIDDINSKLNQLNEMTSLNNELLVKVIQYIMQKDER